jgi:hypothetical protein
MAMAERIDGDAASEIEISLSVFGDEPTALASLERQGCACEGLVKSGTAHYIYSGKKQGRAAICRRYPPVENQKSRPSGGFGRISVFLAVMSTKGRWLTHPSQLAAAGCCFGLPASSKAGKLGKTEKTDSRFGSRLLPRSQAVM